MKNSNFIRVPVFITRIPVFIVLAILLVWVVSVVFKPHQPNPTPPIKIWVEWRNGTFHSYFEIIDVVFDANGCARMTIKSLKGHCMFPSDDYMVSDTSVMLKPYCKPFLIDFGDQYIPDFYKYGGFSPHQEYDTSNNNMLKASIL